MNVVSLICYIHRIEESLIDINLKNLQSSDKICEQFLLILRYQSYTKGWLKKEGHVVKNWKTRYFTLHQGIMTNILIKSIYLMFLLYNRLLEIL